MLSYDRLIRYFTIVFTSAIMLSLAGCNGIIAIRLKIQTKSGHKTHVSRALRPDLL